MTNKTEHAISVLVVDDHPMVREGIVAMLEQQPDLRVMGEATVKTHVNGLMQKLHAASRTEAVTRARAKGWTRT